MPHPSTDYSVPSSTLLQIVLFLGTVALHRTIERKERQAHEKSDEKYNRNRQSTEMITNNVNRTSIQSSDKTTAAEDLNLYAWKRTRDRLSFDATTPISDVSIKAPKGHHHHFEESVKEGTNRCFERSYSKLTLKKDQVVKDLTGLHNPDTNANASCRSLIDYDNMEPKARRRTNAQKTLDHFHRSFNSDLESSSSSDRENAGGEISSNDEDFAFDAASVYATARTLDSLHANAVNMDFTHNRAVSTRHSCDERLISTGSFPPLPPPFPRSLSTSSLKSSRQTFQRARSTYNSRIMPNRVIMVRHGQSEGNINENIYTSKPDNLIQLTKLGWEQARMAGRALRNQILERSKSKSNSMNGNGHGHSPQNTSKLESVHFIVSPYVRTVETFHGMLSAWCDPDEEFGHVEDMELRKIMWYDRLKGMGVTWHEDPRIREQDFGNYQDPFTIKKAKSERHKFGVFYYRFPNGEAASDVYERVSTFLDSLWRSFDVKRSDNYVLVTHGISIRVLLARYFRYSIDQFNMLANPRNAEMILLAHDGKGKLQLEGRCELELKETKDHPDQNREHVSIDVTGFRFYRKLRIVPKHHMRSRTIRLSDK